MQVSGTPGCLEIIFDYARNTNHNCSGSHTVGSFFSGSLGDRYHAPTIVGIGLIGSGMAILFLAVGFWTNFIAMDLGASHLFFLVSFLKICSLNYLIESDITKHLINVDITSS